MRPHTRNSVARPVILVHTPCGPMIACSLVAISPYRVNIACFGIGILPYAFCHAYNDAYCIQNYKYLDPTCKITCRDEKHGFLFWDKAVHFCWALLSQRFSDFGFCACTRWVNEENSVSTLRRLAHGNVAAPIPGIARSVILAQQSCGPGALQFPVGALVE